MTIAVTGHRNIVIDDKLIEEVNAFFVQMLKEYKSITLLSALADGADQLVANYALKHQNIDLEVPLPMEKEAYLETLINKENFLNLLQEAKSSYIIVKRCENPYENLGHYLIDNSDVLLALWDGTHNGKKGGTSDVVSSAKSQNHTVEHIISTRKHN